MLELVAPEVGGVKASDGTWEEADEKLEGGPSVAVRRGRPSLSKEGADVLTSTSLRRATS